MRTVRSLPYGGGLGPGDFSYLNTGGSLSREISVKEIPPPVDRQDPCKIITLPQTSFAGGTVIIKDQLTLRVYDITNTVRVLGQIY